MLSFYGAIVFFTGRGVFAKGSISQGDFVLEYRGDRIPVVEAQRRRLIYHESCTAFLFLV
jgi:SET domain-containing protein